MLKRLSSYGLLATSRTRVVHELTVDECAQSAVLAHQASDSAQAREHLAATAVMLATVDEIGVEAERQVVEKESTVDATDIDTLLGAVEGGERRQRIVAIEAEIARKVVASPERDADERQVALQRDGRHRRQRAVTAGHPERVRRRRARHCVDVVPFTEHVTVDSQRLGGVDQLLGGRAVVPGARVDDQEALARGGHSAGDRATEASLRAPPARPPPDPAETSR